MEGDNPDWVPPEAGAARARPAELTLMDQARAWKHDEDLSNRLTNQAAGFRGHDAVLTIIGLQNAGKLPDRAVRITPHSGELQASEVSGTG